MQGSILFPNSMTLSNDNGLHFGGSDGGANLSTPGNPKTPVVSDPWGSSFSRRGTPGTSGPDSGTTPAGANGSGMYPRSAGRTPSQPMSLLLHDIATPNSHPRGEYNSSRTPGHAGSNLWSRSNSGAAAPPPPPIETLGDFIDRTPEAATPPPQTAGLYGSPTRGCGVYGSPPARGSLAGSYNGHQQGGSGIWGTPPQSTQPGWPPVASLDSWVGAPQSPGGVSAAGTHTPWKSLSSREGAMSPEPSPMADSPVSGVVQGGGMLTLPQSRQMGSSQQPRGSSEDQRWITVYGFGSDDTNLVLREFERCGTITEHVFGPRGANWMHLQYQNMYDARKALSKNSAQLTGSLIIGVKPLDPQLRSSITTRADDGRAAHESSTGSPLSKTVFGPGPRTPAPAFRPYHLQTGEETTKAPGIAQPNRSTLTKIMDFLFSA